MDKLTAELQRLHFLDDSASGAVWVLRVDFQRSGDWAAVAALFAAVQSECDLPAPAISVSGSAGFSVWLPLAEAVSPASAMAFLNGLRQRYLAEIPDNRLHLATGAPIDRVPCLDPATEKWSAFIDPTMGSMFIDEAGLDMAPNMDRQADLLAVVGCIKSRDFERLLSGWAVEGGSPVQSLVEPLLPLGNRFDDPQRFLLAVMNDPAARPEHRIAAAQALLPYFAKAL